MSIRLSVFAVGLLMVAACTEVAPLPGPVPVVPTPGAGLAACGGTPFAAMIGRSVVDLQLAGLPLSARIIRPNDLVTSDFSAQRLNVMLDGSDRVTSLTCG